MVNMVEADEYQKDRTGLLGRLDYQHLEIKELTHRFDVERESRRRTEESLQKLFRRVDAISSSLHPRGECECVVPAAVAALERRLNYVSASLNDVTRRFENSERSRLAVLKKNVTAECNEEAPLPAAVATEKAEGLAELETVIRIAALKAATSQPTEWTAPVLVRARNYESYLKGEGE